MQYLKKFKVLAHYYKGAKKFRIQRTLEGIILREVEDMARKLFGEKYAPNNIYIDEIKEIE